MSQQRFHRYQPEPDQDEPAVKTIVISVVLILLWNGVEGGIATILVRDLGELCFFLGITLTLNLVTLFVIPGKNLIEGLQRVSTPQYLLICSMAGSVMELSGLLYDGYGPFPLLAGFVALNALVLFAIAYNKRTMGGFDS
jgi:hypothetical protein